ncbi:MAG: hypothetical protein A2064_12050 [Spirochaetes bacterium GWB1_66_5]|nr:MAG: hypothetical protein A2064_12050 [Spirochaetes bacterium GWB1_66_5]
MLTLLASARSSSMVLGTTRVMSLFTVMMRAPAAMGRPISLPWILASMAPAAMLSRVFLETTLSTSSTESVDIRSSSQRVPITHSSGG